MDSKGEFRKIEKKEKEILEKETQILNTEQVLLKILKEGPLANITRLRAKMLRKVGRHKLIFALLATVGMVMVWRGTWHTLDEIPIVQYSLVSFGVGVLVLWLLKKYTDMH